MKSALALALFLLGSSAFAAVPAYKIDVKMSIDGNLVSSTQLVTLRGQKASITETSQDGESRFMEVVATEGTVKNNKGIMMAFVIGTVEADGTRNVLSTPQILANENQEASIEIGEANGETLKLEVLAQRH